MAPVGRRREARRRRRRAQVVAQDGVLDAGAEARRRVGRAPGVGRAVLARLPPRARRRPAERARRRRALGPLGEGHEVGAARGRRGRARGRRGRHEAPEDGRLLEDRVVEVARLAAGEHGAVRRRRRAVRARVVRGHLVRGRRVLEEARLGRERRLVRRDVGVRHVDGVAEVLVARGTDGRPPEVLDGLRLPVVRVVDRLDVAVEGAHELRRRRDLAVAEAQHEDVAVDDARVVRLGRDELAAPARRGAARVRVQPDLEGRPAVEAVDLPHAAPEHGQRRRHRQRPALRRVADEDLLRGLAHHGSVTQRRGQLRRAADAERAARGESEDGG